MGLSRAFSSFLEVAVAMNSGDGDDRFRNLVVIYDKLERYTYMEAYASLALEMTGDGSGLEDVLGKFHTEYVGGVLLIPQHICEMLPGLLCSGDSGMRVADFHCRSGRRLLAAARFNRCLRFYGSDSDFTMVQMTLLNLCMNDLSGEVAWFNEQKERFHSAWSIDLDANGKTAIFILPNEKSLIFQKRDGVLSDTSKLIFNY